MFRGRRPYGRVRKSSSQYSLLHHKSVVLLAATIWIGILVGFVAFYWADHLGAEFLQSIEIAQNKEPSALTLRNWLSSAFSWMLMVFLLFLSSMCAFGYPMILFTVLCSGVRIGLDQCCYYRWYGFLSSLLFAAFPAVLFGASVVGLGVQGLRLSASVSKGLVGRHETGVRSSRLFGFTLAWLAIGLALIGVGALLQMLIGTVIGM